MSIPRLPPTPFIGPSLDGIIAIWLALLDVFHPLALFMVAWVGVFAFAHLDIPRTYDEPYYALPFGFLTYGVVLTTAVGFAVGFWLVDPGLRPLRRDFVWGGLRDSVRLDRLGWATAALFAIASATTAFFIWRVGEIPLFSPRIHELRRVFKVPYLGYLFDLHLAATLFAAMLAIWSKSRLHKLLWASVASASVLLLMSMGVRTSPLTAVAWTLVFLGFRPGRFKVRQVVVAVAIFVLVVGVVEQFRRSYYRVDPTRLNPRLDLSVAATIWGHSAASYKNLQLTLEQVTSPLYMGAASYDLPKTFNRDALRVDQEISVLYGTHNTPTFVGFLFFDFGWGGVLIFPGLYGAITALVYRRFRTDPRIFWLVVHLDFVLSTALVFRTSRFFANRLIFFAVVAFAVEMFVGRRRGTPSSQEAGPPPVPALPAQGMAVGP